MTGPLFTIHARENTKRYTIEEYLKAAEIGEVSLIDATHVTTLLEEAREVLRKEVEFNIKDHR